MNCDHNFCHHSAVFFCSSGNDDDQLLFLIVLGSGANMVSPQGDEDMYKNPLIAVSVIACLLFLVLVIIIIKYLRQHRGKTVYKTVNVIPKKVTSKRRQQGNLNQIINT